MLYITFDFLNKGIRLGDSVFICENEVITASLNLTL